MKYEGHHRILSRKIELRADLRGQVQQLNRQMLDLKKQSHLIKPHAALTLCPLQNFRSNIA